MFCLLYHADVRTAPRPPAAPRPPVALVVLHIRVFLPAVLVAQELGSVLMYRMSNSARESAGVDWLDGVDAGGLMELLLIIRIVKTTSRLFPRNTGDPVIVPFLPPYFRYVNPPNGRSATVVAISGSVNACGVRAAVVASMDSQVEEPAGGNLATRVGLPSFTALTTALESALKALQVEKDRPRLKDGGRPALTAGTVNAFYSAVRLVHFGYLAGTADVHAVWKLLLEKSKSAASGSANGEFEIEMDDAGTRDIFQVDPGNDRAMKGLNSALQALERIFPDLIKLQYKTAPDGKGKQKKLKIDTGQLEYVSVITKITDDHMSLAAKLKEADVARHRDSLSKPKESTRHFIHPTGSDIELEITLLNKHEPATILSMFAVMRIIKGSAVALRLYELVPVDSVINRSGQPISSVVGMGGKAIPVNETVVLYTGPTPNESISTFLSCFDHPYGNGTTPIGAMHSDMCCNMPHFSVLVVPQQGPKSLSLVVPEHFASVFSQALQATAVADIARVLMGGGASGGIPAAAAAAAPTPFGLSAMLEGGNGGGGGAAAAAAVTTLSGLQGAFGPRSFRSFAAMVSAFVVMAAAAVKTYLSGAVDGGMSAFHTHVKSQCNEEGNADDTSDGRLRALMMLLEGGLSLVAVLSYKGRKQQSVKDRAGLTVAVRQGFLPFLGSNDDENMKDAIDTKIFLLIVCDTLSNRALLESFGQITNSKGDPGVPATGLTPGTETGAPVAGDGSDAAEGSAAAASVLAANAARTIGQQMSGGVSALLALVAGDNLSPTTDGTKEVRGFAQQLVGYFRTVNAQPEKKLLAIKSADMGGPQFTCTNCEKASDASGATIHTNAAVAVAALTFMCNSCRGSVEGCRVAENCFTDNHRSLPDCRCGQPLKNDAARTGTGDATVYVSGEMGAAPVVLCDTCYEDEVKLNLSDTRPDQLETVTLGQDGSAFDSTCTSGAGKCCIDSRLSGVPPPKRDMAAPAAKRKQSSTKPASAAAGAVSSVVSTVTGTATAAAADAADAGDAGGAGGAGGGGVAGGGGGARAADPSNNGAVGQYGRHKKRRVATVYKGMDVGSGGGGRRGAGLAKGPPGCYFEGTPVGCASGLGDNATPKLVRCTCCYSNFCHDCFASGNKERWQGGTHRPVHVSGIDVYSEPNWAHLLVADVIAVIGAGGTDFDDSMPGLVTAAKGVTDDLDLEAKDDADEIRRVLLKLGFVLCPACTPKIDDFNKAPVNVAKAATTAIVYYNRLLAAAAQGLGIEFTNISLNPPSTDELVITTMKLVGENNVHEKDIELAVKLDTGTDQIKNSSTLWQYGLETLEENTGSSGARTISTTGCSSKDEQKGYSQWLAQKGAEVAAITSKIAMVKAAQKLPKGALAAGTPPE